MTDLDLARLARLAPEIRKLVVYALEHQGFPIDAQNNHPAVRGCDEIALLLADMRDAPEFAADMKAVEERR